MSGGECLTLKRIPEWLIFVVKRRDVLRNMKDPIGLLVAILFAGWGAGALAFPRMWYKVKVPEQAARDQKRIRIFGMAALLLGLILLALHFLA